jgi:hypothetical protein
MLILILLAFIQGIVGIVLSAKDRQGASIAFNVVLCN